MTTYERLSYAYSMYPTLYRTRWMSEAHPIGSRPHRKSYQVDGGFVEPDLNYSYDYSHYHSNQRGVCTIHADCPNGELCIHGKCAEKCLSNNDCALGTECKNGFCRTEFCKTDGDTSSGSCNNQLHNREEPGRAMTIECESDNDCSTGNCMRTANGSFCGRPFNSDPIKMWRKYHALYGMNRM